ncbi:hypothetical protein MBLNU13_g11377t1 [Cladosporium sp. NU13]
MADADPFRLIDLPVEVVARVADFVNSESLFPVHLTCKALQDIPFDRFADEHFAHIYCWIATVDDFRRLRDILHESPRLRSRIQKLTLTTDGLRDLPQTAINYVRRESESEDDALKGAIQFLYPVEGPSYVDVISILRTLQDFKRLPQSVSVTIHLPASSASAMRFDGEHSSHHYTDEYLPQQCILFSLVMSRFKVDSLTVDRFTFEKPEDLWTFSGTDLLATMSTLTSLHMDSDLARPRQDMPMYIDLLRSASGLRHLDFNTGRFADKPGKRIVYLPLPPELLLANDSSYLTSLKITRAVLDGKSLIEMFRRGQNTLTHMILRYVCLTTNNEDLMPVHRAMLDMARPAFLELHWQVAGIRPYNTVDTPHGGVCPESHKYEGIEPIKRWLQELLDNYLYLYYKKADPEQP